MIVKELIEKLKEVDENLEVEHFIDSGPESFDTEITKVELETVGYGFRQGYKVVIY